MEVRLQVFAALLTTPWRESEERRRDINDDMLTLSWGGLIGDVGRSSGDAMPATGA